MQTNLRTIFTCITLLILTACNIPGDRGENPTPNATSIVETAIANANATMTAMAVQVPTIPSNTPAPVITDTHAPTQIQIPTQTNTPQGVWLTVSEETNCRTGPGTTYDRVGGVKVGQSAEVVGRDLASQHWYVRLPDNPVVFCWVISFYATVTGNIGTIPVMTPPPTPTATVTTTPTMDFTVAYIGADSCPSSWFLEFKIVNTGAFVIESVKIVTKDLSAATTFTASYDKFEDWNACLVGSTQMDLTTGESEKTNSGAIPTNPAGHNFEVAVTACTQNGLAGTCLTKTITFTP